MKPRKSFVLIWSVFVGFIAVRGLAPATGSGLIRQEQTPKEITGESYWYNRSLERVLSSHETDEYIVGTIQARHGVSRFRVRKDEVGNPESKSRGLKMVVEELLAWLSSTSKSFADFAQSKLQLMTGEHFTDPSDWKKWHRTEAPYLVWSDRRNRFVTDDEAKRTGVPTEQFRKDHPWAERP